MPTTGFPRLTIQTFHPPVSLLIFPRAFDFFANLLAANQRFPPGKNQKIPHKSYGDRKSLREPHVG
jgi:hypothetical protein